MYSTRWLIGVSGLTHLDDLVAVQRARLRVCFIQDSIEYVLYKVVHRDRETHLDDLVAVQCARLRVCFIQDSIEYVLYKVVHRGKWTHSP